jgi:hypothetical protein
LFVVFTPSLAAPSGIEIVAYRPNWPQTNGNMILQLVPAEGFASSPLWGSKFLTYINQIYLLNFMRIIKLTFAFFALPF